jgi:hypothetical protein
VTIPFVPFPIIKAGPTSPRSLGVRNDALAEDAGAHDIVTIEVRGARGAASGIYRLAYSQEATIRTYLRRLKLVHAALYSAVYDETKGQRCRLSYVPQKGAKIILCPGNMGLATQFQRSHHDAQDVAVRMGRRTDGTIAKIVEVLHAKDKDI